MSLLELLKSEDQQEGSRILGVALGLVTNNQDPEGLGRVKVKYPWRENSPESFWARIAVMAAGNDRGTVWIPEVDDEVLVGFDKGNIEHPYVLGSLWNGKDKPPEKNSDGDNNTKLIKSRCGHQIKFFEEKPKVPKSTLTGIALYYYPKKVLPLIYEYISEGNNPDQPGRLVQWLYPRVPFYVWKVPGLWYDVGSIETLEEANRVFSRGSNG